MSLADLKAMSEDELSVRLIDLKKESFNMRFQRAGGQLNNTARMRTVRRDVARIKTLLGERRRAAGQEKS